MKKNNPKWLVVLLLCVCVSAVSVVSTGLIFQANYTTAETVSVPEAYAKYEKLEEIKALVDQYYVGTYDEQELMDGLSEGFLTGIGDKWAYYTPASDVAEVSQNRSGVYAGIGISASYESDTGLILVTNVTKDGPAQSVGIQVSDRIYSVDGVLVQDMSFSEAVEAVRGEAGTTVEIQVLRNDIIYNFTVERATLEQVLVEAELLEGNIGYIRVESFATSVRTQFQEKLTQLQALSPDALIVDVRNNGGGSIYTLTYMLDLLMPEGTAIITTDKSGEVEYITTDADYWDIPLVVLANEYSISAAEYFAAVLQETGRATVVGGHTTGKGEGQSTFTLSDGSTVAFSTIKYYTPAGVSLSAVGGIAPDIAVDMTYEQLVDIGYVEASEDPQIVAAMEFLTETTNNS